MSFKRKMLIKKSRIPVVSMLLLGFFPSSIKKIVYKLKGYKIGKKVSIGFGSVIIGDKVEIQNNTKIGFFTVIRAKKIKIGRFVKIGSLTFIDTERIEIDDDARINEQVVIGGLKFPDSFLKLGKRTIIMELSFINPTKPIIIGDDTGIGGHCLLFTHGSWLSQLEGYPVTFAPITLGKNVWLPWRVFILPGVNVGDNVVIGANSLITKSLPSNCLAAGSPAKIISDDYPKSISSEKRHDILFNIFSDFMEFIKYYQFDVIKKNIENGLHINIEKNKKKHSIIYLYDVSEKEKFEIDNDHVYIKDYIDDGDQDNNYKMVINLKKKTRLGSSVVGEELVTFFSRYGIRFDRMD